MISRLFPITAPKPQTPGYLRFVNRPSRLRLGLMVILRQDLQGDSPPAFTPLRFARFALVAM